jgi:hypothetical protein
MVILLEKAYCTDTKVRDLEKFRDLLPHRVRRGLAIHTSFILFFIFLPCDALRWIMP